MFRQSVYGFAALAALALAAFWPSYVSRLGAVPWPVHAHALAMSLWCAMLIAQAWLIRSGHRGAHRALGRLSYILVPAVVIATLALARYMLRNAKPPVTEETLYFFYLQMSLLAVFGYAYAQAIRHRAKPWVHGAYMAGTALALVDPVVARLLYYAFGAQPPFMQVATFLLVDIVLVVLLVRERKHGAGPRVFAKLLAVFVAAQVPTFFVFRTPAWRSFADTFAGL